MESFDSWISRVDRIISAATGLTHDDLPDACWRDWFDDGLTPKEAWQTYQEDNEEFDFD